MIPSVNILISCSFWMQWEGIKFDILNHWGFKLCSTFFCIISSALLRTFTMLEYCKNILHSGWEIERSVSGAFIFSKRKYLWAKTALCLKWTGAMSPEVQWDAVVAFWVQQSNLLRNAQLGRSGWFYVVQNYLIKEFQEIKCRANLYWKYTFILLGDLLLCNTPYFGLHVLLLEVSL